MYQFAHSNLSRNVNSSSSRGTYLTTSLVREILTQKLGDDRPLLIQREHVIGQVVVVSQCPQSMGQLEQTLTAASTAVPARERARGTVLQAHPCEKRIHRLLLIPPRTRPATREIVSPISHDKTKEDKGKSRKIDRSSFSNRRSLPRERL